MTATRPVRQRAAVGLAVTAGHVVRAAPGVGGLGLVAYGAYLAFHPAGFIVGGLGLLADRIIATARNAKGAG